MALTCPRCARRLADSADPADRPQFCMFCGQKLSASASGEAGGPRVGSGVLDGHTQAFVPTPSENADTVAPEPGDATDSAEPQLTTVGGYQLVRFIGAGGMGQVYEAESADTGRRVAVKILSGRLAANPASVERFRQEGRVASQISHPNCVFVLGADADAGRPYIVMELMPGRTLKDVVDREGPLPVGIALAWILDVVDGLAEAHRLGVIHRDVKPSNCFLTADGRVKVGDFGLSKSLAPDQANQQLTHSGAFLGTVLFASPEQIRGEPVGYDSDVYAACGTLYYLLTGRAPYQHESLTASLAKAVSEPPPPVRDRRPDVPRELERVLLCGLERVRDRRWQTLEELADALRQLQPERQQPARPRALVAAYLIDALLIAIAWRLLDLVGDAFGGFSPPASVRVWLEYASYVLYFGVPEGLLGWTPGKRLVRLRVVRVGRTDPPGLLGPVRAAVFEGVWFAPFFADDIVTAVAGAVSGTFAGDGYIFRTDELAGLVAFAAVGVPAVLALAVQFLRTPLGWRGLHDRATGCRVVQRPRTPVRVKLVSRYPDPLGRTDPTAADLPASVGGFRVSGKVAGLPDGGEVWLAEDRSLGRRVLVRVLPPGAAEPDGTAPAVTRPTRLRVVGSGSFVWAGGERGWVGYVAPGGAPLVDVVNPARPLGWAEARTVLEQLAAELDAADADGSAVVRPAVSQVWVEPGGRMQLLDFPLPTGSKPAKDAPRPPGRMDSRVGPPDPLDFVRQVATLVLEGRPRAAGRRVSAPIPPHASRVTDRLFDGSGFMTAARLKAELADDHGRPAQVTTGHRAAHLGAQAAMLAFGAAVMVLTAGLFNWSLAFSAAEGAYEAARVADAIQTADGRQATLARAREAAAAGQFAGKRLVRLEAALAPDKTPATVARLRDWADHRQHNLDRQMKLLNRPERDALAWVRRVEEQNLSDTLPPPQLVASFVESSAEEPSPAEAARLHLVLLLIDVCIVVTCPLGWAAFAFAFRGGLAMHLAGITLVRSDGRRAGRFRCAVRELAVWAPVVGVLLVGLWIQYAAPGMVMTRTAIWLGAVLMLPLYVAVALRNPTRPPQDQLLGTYIVPA